MSNLTLQRSRALLVALTIGPVVVGLALIKIFGGQFLFRYGDTFRDAFWIASPFLVVGIMWAGLRSRATRESMQAQMPTAWIRWIAWPMFSFLCAGLLFLAVLGWIIGASSIAASEAVEIDAVIHVIEPYSRPTRGGCGQRVDLEIQGIRDRVCFTELRVTGSLRSGASAMALGRVSRLGIHLQELKAR